MNVEITGAKVVREKKDKNNFNFEKLILDLPALSMLLS